MAVQRRKDKPRFEVYVAPPIDEAGRERLKNTPGVVYRHRVNGNTPAFVPSIRVREGYDVWKVIEQEEEEEIAAWLRGDVE